jgi:hypothetical protein
MWTEGELLIRENKNQQRFLPTLGCIDLKADMNSIFPKEEKIN